MISSVLKTNLIFPLTLLFFGVTYAGAADIINNEDLIGLVIYLFIITNIQYLVIKKIFGTKDTLNKLTFAIITTINIHVVALDFMPEFAALKFLFEISILFALTILLFFLFDMASKSKKANTWIPIITLISLSNIFYVSAMHSDSTEVYLDHIGTETHQVEPVTVGMDNKEKYFYDITLKDKPDIIILSFESLISEKKYRSQTKRPAQLPVHRSIERNINSYTNHFSDELSTRLSIASMFALTPEYYHSLEFDKAIHRELSPRFTMVNGLTPSPLLHILKSNGYETSTFAEYIDFWGKNKGPYVDNYSIPPLTLTHTSNVCKMFGIRTGQNVFFGYCNIRESLSSIMQKEKVKDPELVWTTEFGTEDMNYYLYYSLGQAYNNMKKLINNSNKKDSKPQFLYGHINHPDHMSVNTSPNWKNKSDGTFREFVIYYESRARIAHFMLEKTFELFKDRKKDTIIYIFGDHGMSLSWHLKWDQETFEDQKFSWDRDGFFILGDKTIYEAEEFNDIEVDKSITYTRDGEPYHTIDRYGSYGGLYSDHECALYSQKKNKERKYQTPMLTMHDLISCLADDSSKSNNYLRDFNRTSTLRSQNWHEDFSNINTHHDYVKFEPREYLNYLYE